MKGQNFIFIIPGFRQKPTQKVYKQLSSLLKTRGFTPIVVPVDWRQKTISENSEYFLKMYKKIPSSRKYVLGFSYGAMIAFVSATKLPVQGLILCSLSPYFKEDLDNLSRSEYSTLPELYYQDFSKLQFNTLSKKIKAKKLFMIFGMKEELPLIIRSIDTFHTISAESKYLIAIRNTYHNISDKKYLRAISYISHEIL